MDAGPGDEAQSWLEQLAEEQPRSYYGLRAAHLLDNGGLSLDSPPFPSDVELSSDPESEEAEVAAWLGEWGAELKKVDSARSPQR